MSMRVPPALGLLLLLGGCALDRALEEDSAAAASAARGRALAERVCVACHAVQRGGASPRAGAPPLPEAAAKFSPEGLDAELTAVAEVGHYDMPRLALTPEDRRDLIAYLKPRSWRRPGGS